MADEEDGDTYVTIGTPFQPLEEDEGEERRLVYAKERKPGETYRERRERQRFHGAFTGGFSAGYFNTVGSEAGWTPSSFSSSRRNKAELMAQQPEDYMDDEDLGRYGIAPRRITATREFRVDPQEAVDELGRVLGKRQHTGKERDASVLADLFGDSFLKDIVRPARTSVGSSLLKGMGWKEGQGVGSKRAQKMEKGTKSYSCLLHPSVAATEGGGLSQEGAAVLLAPRDVRPWLAEPKDDLHGIGYSGIQEDRVGEMKGKARSTGVHGISGQAFGVGALEEDDDDIYSSDRLTDYHSNALAEEEGEEKFGWTGPHATVAWSLSSAFKLLKGVLRLQKVYAPPVLPKDYKPVRKATATEKAHNSHRQPSYPLDAIGRAQLISGKASEFSTPKSEDQERLQSGSTATERAQVKRTNRWDQAPPPVDRSAENHGAHRSSSCHKQLYGMTEWQREESSRQVFPTGATLNARSFASKFTSAGHIGDGKELPSKVDDRVQSVSEDKACQLSREVLQWYPHRVLCKRFDIPDPYPRSGVVGVPKAVEKTQVDSRAKSLAFSAPLIASLDTAKQGGSHGNGVQEGLAAGGGLWRGREGGSHGDQESNEVKQSAADAEPPVSKEEEEGKIQPETEPEKRPSLDIFKAIFAETSASESDSESGEDQKEVQEAGMDDVKVAQGPLPPAPVKDNRFTLSNTAVRQTDGSGSNQELEEGMDVCTREHPQGSQDTREHPQGSQGTREHPQGSQGTREHSQGSQDTREHPQGSQDTREHHQGSQGHMAAVSFGPALPPLFSAEHSDSSSDDNADRQIRLTPSKERHRKKKKKEKTHKKHKHKDKHKHKRKRHHE